MIILFLIPTLSLLIYNDSLYLFLSFFLSFFFIFGFGFFCSYLTPLTLFISVTIYICATAALIDHVCVICPELAFDWDSSDFLLLFCQRFYPVIHFSHNFHGIYIYMCIFCIFALFYYLKLTAFLTFFLFKSVVNIPVFFLKLPFLVFYNIHYLLLFVISTLVILYLFFSLLNKRSSLLGISSNTNKVSFRYYYLVRNLYIFIVFLFILYLLL